MSLREATKALAFLGILESITGVGLTVGRIDMARLTEHLGFHTGLLEAFGDLLHVFFQRFRESVKKAGWKAGLEGHRRLVDHLAAGRMKAATDELRKHIESHKNRIPNTKEY